MRLYLVERNDADNVWDEYAAFLIAANSEEDARQIANHENGGGKWVDDKFAKCRHVGEATSAIERGVVYSDFKHG